MLGVGCYLFVALASADLFVPFTRHVAIGQDYLLRRVGVARGSPWALR